MLSMILALLVQAQSGETGAHRAAQTQVQTPAYTAQPANGETRAALEGCVMEGGRWVCRYTMPALEIVPTPGSGAAQVYTNATVTPAGPPTTVAAPPAIVMPAPTLPAPAVTNAPVVAAAEAVLDPGVLNEREQKLVSRCADAGWASLCLPAERREARALRDRQTAYQAVRLQVTSLMGQNQCDAAVRTALQTGNLALAREARDFCAGQTDADTAGAARSTPPA
ncbi:MAG: hypothetical protein EON88_11440 [Brevundimonas sp.]|nr:MAG: hypothetical protein EON88_11440 [Brevundimonas sp.]